MSPAARETLIDQNFMSLGMGLIETGMAGSGATSGSKMV
nr:Uncharacterised protein [Klebsiella pneumoniae]